MLISLISKVFNGRELDLNLINIDFGIFFVIKKKFSKFRNYNFKVNYYRWKKDLYYNRVFLGLY